jgi:Peptidase A4 family/Ricin-type beta-trefoil lectin domain-like
MFRSMQRPGRDLQARWRGIGEPGSRLATPERSRPTARARRRNQWLNCEALEGRQMLSGFYIVNMESGLALDDTNFSTSNGNLVQQWQPTGGLNQRWNLVSLPDGNDEIVNAYSGKVLDDTNWSTSNGTQIQQWQATGGTNQQWKIVPLAGGTDEIVNAYSGKVLDDTNFSTSNGTIIQQWQATGNSNQQWKLLAAGNAPTVTNYVADASSGKVLDDTNFSTSNGNIMQQWQPTGGSNQQWTFISLADGNDLIVNVNSGKVLDDTNFSTSNGNLIQQWQATGNSNQEWKLVAQSDGTDELLNAYSNKVLDDTNALTNNGNKIQQWQANGGVSEHWHLLAAGYAPTATYSIINANSGKALDDTNFSTSNQTKIQQWQPTGASNQQWTFISLADGHDLIVNEYSGLVLDDPSSSTSGGTLMQQFQLNGGTNQQWYTYTLADGNVVIFNAASNEVLDVPYFSTSNGTQIQQYVVNDGTNQQWYLFVPNANPGTTPNWSGYAAQSSSTSSRQDSVTSVSGSWVVPRVTDPSGFNSSGKFNVYAWVGIDGYGTGTVEQVGTQSVVLNGVAHYYAWWEMWSSVNQQEPQPISSMDVEPGDSITGSVQYVSSGTHAGQFELTITDTSRSNDSYTTYQTSAANQYPLATRSTAEWIVEAPGGNSPGQYQTLPDFGEVTFTGATAVINGVSGPINSSSWQSEALNMTSNGSSSGVKFDTTSPLTSSGRGFAVVYNSSGTATSSNGSMAMAQAGSAVGTALAPARTGRPMIGGSAATGASGLSPVAPIDPTALDALLAESDSSHDDSPQVKAAAAGQSSDSDVYLSILPASSGTAFGDGGAGIDILGKRRIFGRA